MKNSTILWIVIGLIAVVGGLIAFGHAPKSSHPVENSALLTIAPDDYVKGATTSPVVLIEYLDFECEACGAYYPIVKQLEQEYGDRVTFVARYFPLAGHRNGLPAAYAAEAAARQGKFWEMHDLLFTRQGQWGEKQVVTPEVFEGYAEELDLNMDQFRADVASDQVASRVKRDMDAGRQLGVNSTPTFFLNGEQVRPQGYEPFKAAIEAKLQ